MGDFLRPKNLQRKTYFEPCLQLLLEKIESEKIEKSQHIYRGEKKRRKDISKTEYYHLRTEIFGPVRILETKSDKDSTM